MAGPARLLAALVMEMAKQAAAPRPGAAGQARPRCRTKLGWSEALSRGKTTAPWPAAVRGAYRCWRQPAPGASAHRADRHQPSALLPRRPGAPAPGRVRRALRPAAPESRVPGMARIQVARDQSTRVRHLIPFSPQMGFRGHANQLLTCTDEAVSQFLCSANMYVICSFLALTTALYPHVRQSHFTSGGHRYARLVESRNRRPAPPAHGSHPRTHRQSAAGSLTPCWAVCCAPRGTAGDGDAPQVRFESALALGDVWALMPCGTSWVRWACRRLSPSPLHQPGRARHSRDGLQPVV